MSSVPFLDLKEAYDELSGEIESAVMRVLRSGWYIGGTEVEAFEREFAHYAGAENCVGVANGLDALTLALMAFGVGPGDEVIVPSHTYIATWLAVSRCGAMPVPVEPTQVFFNIDPAQIEDSITEKTKAIIPVHLYGMPVDLDPIIDICKKYELWLLEDAAQCHGARYKGKRIGSHGDAVAWSFYPGKNLGALGDGGAVTTNNGKVAHRIRMLSNYGSEKRYIHVLQGVNSRLDPVQAALLRVKLRYLDEWNARRCAVAALYSREFADLELGLPLCPNWANPVWHLYVVGSSERDDLQRSLAKEGISTLIHYPIPPHLQKAYSELGFGAGCFPIAEALASQLLSLPIGPHLSAEEQEKVITELRCLLNRSE